MKQSVCSFTDPLAAAHRKEDFSVHNIALFHVIKISQPPNSLLFHSFSHILYCLPYHSIYIHTYLCFAVVRAVKQSLQMLMDRTRHIRITHRNNGHRAQKFLPTRSGKTWPILQAALRDAQKKSPKLTSVGSHNGSNDILVDLKVLLALMLEPVFDIDHVHEKSDELDVYSDIPDDII